MQSYSEVLDVMALTYELVKNLPAMQETPVQFLDWKDPLEKGMATHSSLGFPHGSVGKESACNAGYPGLIPGSGSTGEGIGYPLQYSWASFLAQLVKNPPANAGDLGSLPRLGRSPGEGKGISLQYSSLQ